MIKHILTEEHDEFLTCFGRDRRNSSTMSIFIAKVVRI